MENRAFLKAIDRLSHPVTLGAILVLLVNDHVLRRVWPSWWTGKIGDLAWLFFAPLLLAAFLSWVIPSRSPRQSRVVGGLAFAVTAGVFTVAKLTPIGHALIVRSAEMLFGFPVGWRRDPSDLIALLALGLGWWFWNREGPAPAQHSKRGVVALMLGSLLTVANAGAPDYGITCLLAQDSRVYAIGVDAYVSTDGGLTWGPAEGVQSSCSFADDRETCRYNVGSGVCEWPPRPGPVTITDATNPDVIYRFTPGVMIERSDDGGQTWQQDYALAPPAEVEQAYYAKARHNVYFRPGPLDVFADPATGNIILAMGHEGLLVHRFGTAGWQWVAVADYRSYQSYHDVERLNAVTTLLRGEVVQALAFGLLSVSTLARRLGRSRIRYVLIGASWLFWVVPTLFFPHALRHGPWEDVVLYMLWLAGALFIVPLSIYAFSLVISASWKHLSWALLILGINAALFFLPYLLWALGALPRYWTAVPLALALGGAAFVIEDRLATRWLQVSVSQ